MKINTCEISAFSQAVVGKEIALVLRLRDAFGNSEDAINWWSSPHPRLGEAPADHFRRGDACAAIVTSMVGKLESAKRDEADIRSGELLDVKQVADRLKVSTGTVRRLAHKGEIRCKLVASRLRFRSQWIDEYLDREDDKCNVESIGSFGRAGAGMRNGANKARSKGNRSERPTTKTPSGFSSKASTSWPNVSDLRTRLAGKS